MSVLGRGRGSWKKPSEQLVRQHSGGLLLEHLPGEYQRVYGTPIPPDWPTVVEKCTDLTEENAPGVGQKILHNFTTTNFINQDAENTWIVEVLEVLSTADISVRIDDDVIEKCSLYALEDLHDDEELTVFLKEVLCQRIFSCHLVSLDTAPPVVLYDDKINMNLRFAEQTALQVAPVQLKEGMSPCVRVTYIAEKLSFVCVRLTEQYFELLTRSLNMVMRLKSETKRKRFVVCKKDLKKLCILQINSNWYRVSLKSQASISEVIVNLVDVGSSVSIDPFSLIVLDSISAVFANVPPQAVEVALDPIHNHPQVYDLLTRSKTQKTELVMKVLKSHKMQLPLVVFRDPADKTDISSNSPKFVGDILPYQLVGDSVHSLNSSLPASTATSPVDEEQPKLTPDDSSARVVSDNEGDVKYWKSLVGKHFKVHVSSATSPFNIMLQLSKNRPALEMLMEMIQEHYDLRTADLDDPGEIQLKTVYAAFVKDWWYRVKVISICTEDTCVYLLDYGTQVSVECKYVRKLPKELGQEVLPFQTFRAELKGARDVVTTKEDSAKALEDLLLDKTFTCKVWKVENDYPCPVRIEVDLFSDTGDSVLDVIYPAAVSPT